MISSFFTPPRFDDSDKTYTASQLWRILVLMAGTTILYLIIWLALVPEFTSRIVLALPLFPLYVWLFYLIKKGNIKLASIALVAGIWFVLFFASLFSGGVLAPGYSGFLVTILAAAIFMGRDSAVRIAWISVFVGALFVFLERAGLTPLANEFTDSTTMWIAQAIYFFVASSLLHMATQRISNALQTAQHEIEQRSRTEVQLRTLSRAGGKCARCDV